MNPIDAFPEHISTTVVPVTLPEKPDALEYTARKGQVRAGVIYQEPNAKPVFLLFCKDRVTNMFGTFPLIFLGVFLGNINSSSFPINSKKINGIFKLDKVFKSSVVR
ncbi:uncharacterized protein TNCV_1616601 [Trichonephila clavipes]|nr:uncharacterized protein TNCV_1616601 [Trichonephila clavipes]